MSIETSILITNCSLESLVFVLYSSKDTLQVQGCYKFEINSSATYNHWEERESVYRMHVFRRGVMGLISPRTRMSSGYGFVVRSNARYRVNVIERDHSGSWVSLEEEIEGEPFHEVRTRLYHFGDMILKPLVSTLAYGGLAMLSGLDSNIYRDWINRRNRGITSDISNTESSTASGAQPPTEGVVENTLQSQTCNSIAFDCAVSGSVSSPPASLPERELWGVFFEQIYQAGTWALDEGIISPDDVEGQEAFLFIGLPAISLCNVVIRSVQAAECPRDMLLLVDGRCIRLDTCPVSFASMFTAILMTSQSLRDITPLTANEVKWVRAFLLVAGSEKDIPGSEDICETRKNEMRGAFSHLVGVATSVTQLEFFKGNFLSVLEHLESWTPPLL